MQRRQTVGFGSARLSNGSEAFCRQAGMGNEVDETVRPPQSGPHREQKRRFGGGRVIYLQQWVLADAAPRSGRGPWVMPACNGERFEKCVGRPDEISGNARLAPAPPKIDRGHPCGRACRRTPLLLPRGFRLHGNAKHRVIHVLRVSWLVLGLSLGTRQDRVHTGATRGCGLERGGPLALDRRHLFLDRGHLSLDLRHLPPDRGTLSRGQLFLDRGTACP